MENIVSSFLTNVDFELLIELASFLIAIFLGITIKNKIQKIIAFRSFKNSMNVGIGTWVRMPTAVGHIDGKIIRADAKRIVIETDVSYIYVPTIEFSSKTWQILKYYKEKIDA